MRKRKHNSDGQYQKQLWAISLHLTQESNKNSEGNHKYKTMQNALQGNM
jgi:hypothetical protein